MTHLKIGDKAPEFDSTDQDGNKIVLKRQSYRIMVCGDLKNSWAESIWASTG